MGSTGSIDKHNTSVDISGFDCSFEMIQVPIVRPWFAPEFLKLKSWRFEPGAHHGLFSDGARPPKGDLIGYGTTCVFVRNLKMNFAELHKKDSMYVEAIKNNMSASYGPFVAVSGNYNRSVADNKFSSKITSEGLIVDGMQLIAMKCQLLPKAPDPDKTIQKWS